MEPVWEINWVFLGEALKHDGTLSISILLSTDEDFHHTLSMAAAVTNASVFKVNQFLWWLPYSSWFFSHLTFSSFFPVCIRCPVVILVEAFQCIQWSIHGWRVFLREGKLWFPCWGDLLCFDSYALPCSLTTHITQSSLTQTHTRRTRRAFGAPAIPWLSLMLFAQGWTLR